MKHCVSGFLLLLICVTQVRCQKNELNEERMTNAYEILKTESRLRGLKLAITHAAPPVSSNDYAVLFLHGASFPSALAFGFKMSNYSWMDHLSEKGYDVYALDFLGYGHSDRYPEMHGVSSYGKPLGRASDIYQDVDKAIAFVLAKTKKSKVYLIGHSWGGSVAALYATKFPDKIAALVLFASVTQRKDTSSIEKNEVLFEMMTPEQRVSAMKGLTPDGKIGQLEPEIEKTWGAAWLQSDPVAKEFDVKNVRFPSGYAQDIEELTHNRSYYDPAAINAPTLIIRGEWDRYPDNSDSEQFFKSLENAPYKKYVVIEKGTHVMHLEKSRYQLYNETYYFLKSVTNMKETNKRAIAVIFEVIPASAHREEYLNIALSLKSELQKIDGFISIERFQSIYHPEKILSLSFWENEEAIQKWRTLEIHRDAQHKGRAYIFKDYRLRIGQVVRDYGMFERTEAPADSEVFHEKKN